MIFYLVTSLVTWLFISDSVRKLTPGQPGELAIVADLFVGLIYAVFLFLIFRKKVKLWKPAFSTPLIFYSAFVFVDALFTSESFTTGALNIRTHVWYMGLAFVGYYIFSNKERAIKLVKVLAFVAIPLFLFAVFQYLLWDSSVDFLRPFETANQHHSFTGGKIYKIPSFFGAGQRYGMVSVILFFLGLGLFSRNQENKKTGNQEIFLRIATFSALGGVMLSASRSAFMMIILGLFLFYMLRGFYEKDKIKAISSGFLKSVATSLAIILTLLIMSQLGFRLGNYYLDTFPSLANQIVPRLSFETSITFPHLSIFGSETGSMAQGAKFAENDLSRAYHSVESGITRLIFEFGVTGLILFFLLWGAIIYFALKSLKLIKDKELTSLGVAVIVILLVTLARFTFVHFQALADGTTLILIWLLVGVLYRLPSLDGNLRIANR